MTCSITCYRTTGARTCSSWTSPAGSMDWEDPGEQIRGTATAVHPTDPAVLAAPGSRGRRADHRVHRALLRHRPLPADTDRPRDRVDRAEHNRGGPALRPVSLHPAQPGLFHAGRLRGAADPAGPESPGEPGPGRPRRGPPPRRADQGRHRVSGPRTGRVAA